MNLANIRAIIIYELMVYHDLEPMFIFKFKVTVHMRNKSVVCHWLGIPQSTPKNITMFLIILFWWFFSAYFYFDISIFKDVSVDIANPHFRQGDAGITLTVWSHFSKWKLALRYEILKWFFVGLEIRITGVRGSW